MMTEQKQTHILPFEGENQQTGWHLEFTTNLPFKLPDGTLIQSARFTRGDGKYYDAEYLPANSEHNPTKYGFPGIIEHGKDGIVGSILTMISKDDNGGVIVSTIENVRMGNNGLKPMLEIKRASIDNTDKFQQIAELNHTIGQIYSNNARITGDQPTGAPINIGLLILNEPTPDSEWKPLKQFALECEEDISLGATFKAIAYLGLLDNIKLPQNK